MTIELVGIGAAPGDNTGDGLRTAMGKVNNNFSNSSHAASKLIGTATGRVLLSESAGLDNGETNWTSGNLNSTVFGGGAGSSNIVGYGFAETATNGAILLELDGVTDPIGITQTGTFEIKDIGGGITYSTGVTLTFNVGSSSRLAYLTFTGAGMTVSQPVMLVKNTVSSKIEVNF